MWDGQISVIYYILVSTVNNSVLYTNMLRG